MTALDLSDIPSGINTYERLLTWATQAVQSISNGGTVNVRAGEDAQPEAYCGVFRAADGTDRFYIAAYLPVDVDALNDPNAKTWMAAEDISTADPHTNLLSN